MGENYDRKQIIEEQLRLADASIENANKQVAAGLYLEARVLEELFKQKSRLLEELKQLDKAAESPAPNEEIGIPSRLRIPRSYTMTEAAREQRRNASHSPARAEAMKGNKNPWKHGKFAQGYIDSFIRPCKSSCPDYPCDIVDQKGTKPGGMCLDQAAVIQGYRAIVDAMKEKPDRADFNDLAALTLSKTINMIHMLMDDIMRDGTMAKKEKHDKDGTVCGYEIVPHPSLFTLPKLLQGIGLTPSELMLTPQAVAKHKVETKKAKTLADIMSGFGSRRDHEES